MAKISMAAAAQVAGKLVEKIQIEITAENKKLSKYITEKYLETIPKDVMRMWEKGKKWMHGTESLKIKGVGIADDYHTKYTMTGKYPNCSGNYYGELQLRNDEAEAAVAMIDRIQTLKDKKSNTYKEIEALLLAMGTWKKAVEAIPEIASYAPRTEKVGIMIVPKATREKIQCLIEPQNKSCLETL